MFAVLKQDSINLRGLLKMKRAALLYNRFMPVSIDSRIFFIPIAFLLGRVVVSEGMMPFGYAFYAASAGILPQRLLLALAVMAGVVTGGEPFQISVNFVGIVLFSALYYALSKGKVEHIKTRQSELSSKYAVISFVSIFIPLFISTAFQGFLLYDALAMIFYIIATTAAFYVFRLSLIAMLLKKSEKVIYNEEIAFIAIAIGIAVAGFADFTIWELNIKSIACLTLVMMAAYKGGSGTGAGAGVVLGLIAGIASKEILLTVNTFALLGFISGAIKSKKKPVVALVVVAGAAVLSLFIREIINPFVYLKELAVSAIIFVLIPRKLIDKIMGLVRVGGRAETAMINSSARIRNYITGRLENFSNAFGEL
jgi:stage II sporulation protein E